MSSKKRFHIDERYVTVNLTLSIILYSMVVPFCVYLAVDNFIRGDLLVARYALFCAVMTAFSTICFAICKFGKKRRRWLMHLSINIQCFVYWITFTFFLYTGGTGGTSIFLIFLAVPVVFFFFNLSYGLYFNMVMFLIMIVYMSTPLREAGYQFPETYYSRLPMMYLANVVMCAIAQYETVKAKIKQDHALEEARRASEAKTDFLANTSHEIRTPINAVLGMNEMILRESVKAEKNADADPEEYKKAFGRIRHYSGNVDSAGHNLLSIINDILDFTKIEEGRMDIVKVEYQLSSLINDVSNMIYFKAKEKNLSFITDVDESLPDRLFGDVVRVRQVITNILNNAVKYTDQGSVSLKITGTKEVPSSSDAKALLRLSISVKDTGIGISQENMSKLFGKFERVDLVRNSTKEGTGLGLAITKMLLDMMGGDISVESTYGEGSTFTVSIPQEILSDEPVGNFTEKFEKSLGEKKAYHESFRAPSAKILIVDDTKMNLVVATAFLKETQVMIDTASGGKESVELAGKNKYDVILMDQRMPRMDGSEALHAIRKQEDGLNRNTPVICLTADAIMGARDRYIAEGFTDYLTKPIDSQALERMLLSCLPEEKVLPVQSKDRQAADVPSPEPESGTDPCFPAGEEYAFLSEAGIDPDVGLACCQKDAGLYRTLLLEYASDAEKKAKNIQTYFDQQDWKNYAVMVHSVKSTSRMIGAAALSDLAYVLERAADEENLTELDHQHMLFLAEYKAAAEAISSGISHSTEPPEEEEIIEFFPEQEKG